MSSVTPGTNLAPISFPGIASGIDYNAIITKLTALQLSQNDAYNNQITGLTSANAELIKINSMFTSVQNALGALSNPLLFNAVSANSSNPAFLTAQGVPNVSATAGTYKILATTLATASSVTSSLTYGHSERDMLAGLPAEQQPLANSYVQITPSNGDSSKGAATVTVDGVQVTYDVTTMSMDFILNKIQTAVQAVDPTFLATVAAGTDQVVFQSSGQPISLGSASDNGNILQVFKLDQAQLTNTPTSGLITAVAGVGGVNAVLPLDSTNGPAGVATNANYQTPVTSGTFTINGVAITVDNTKDALVDIIKRINNSGAGVTASFNQETGQISLINNATGPQSIVLGKPGDTSNFLSASGLTGAGATTSIGAQASVQVQNAAGVTSTVYSNSNTVTTAIPGVQLNLLQAQTTPSTITVSSDSTGLISAINTFVTAYNSVVNEINLATMPPTVIQSQLGSPVSNKSVGGGPLYNNADVLGLKDTLTGMLSGLMRGATTGYNSFSTIGLTLTDSFTVIAPSAAGSSGGPVTTQTLQGTDGGLAPLDVAKFQAAFAANPSQVQALFTSSQGIVSQLATYLTGITGAPSLLASGVAGTIPSISIMQGFENSNSDQIASLQQQVKLVTDGANMYADELRANFQASERQIAQFQSLQSQLAGFFKNG